LNEHDLQAKRTLFIDDKRKYWRCAFIRFTVWNLQVGKEDVVDLFNKTYYRNLLEVKDTYNTINLRPKKYYIKKKIVNFSVLPIYSIGRRSKTHYRRFKKNIQMGHFVMPIK
jgi:hypothetical protein